MKLSRQLAVYCFFAAFFMLLASGRMGSSDAYAQLQAATLLAVRGSLGTVNPPASSSGMWVKSRSGLYYEAHDIGNIALMYFPAKLATLLSHAPPESHIENPSIAARFGIAVMVVLWSAVGALFMVKLFSGFHPFRVSFLLGLLFVTATIYWPYTKSAWDVCGACTGVSILLYGASRMLLSDPIPLRAYFWTALGFIVSCSFRYSAGPFLALSLTAVLWTCRRRLEMKSFAAFAILIGIGLLPTFIYNHVRMDSWIRPATTAEQFASGQSLTGSIPAGLYGLIFSPNRGLLWFSPICLLLFLLPFLWRRLSDAERKLTGIFALAAIPYILMIAKIPNWGAFGWGPRYLVPILPIIFFPIATAIALLWSRWSKALLPLIILSVVLNGAAVFVNWDLATAEYPPLKKPNSAFALLPYQQMAVWNGVALALQGKPLPNEKRQDDDIRKAAGRFPDLWEVRLMERNTTGVLVGIICLIALLTLSLALLIYLLKDSRENDVLRQPI